MSEKDLKSFVNKVQITREDLDFPLKRKKRQNLSSDDIRRVLQYEHIYETRRHCTDEDWSNNCD